MNSITEFIILLLSIACYLVINVLVSFSMSVHYNLGSFRLWFVIGTISFIIPTIICNELIAGVIGISLYCLTGYFIRFIKMILED